MVAVLTPIPCLIALAGTRAYSMGHYSEPTRSQAPEAAPTSVERGMARHGLLRRPTMRA